MELDTETAIKAALLTLTVSIFLIIYNLPKKALSNLRTNNRTSIQSNRHFLNGAHLLSRSRSTRNKATSSALAKDALSEADKALLLKPRDAAAHILRGLALDQLGHRAAALKALDAALAPPVVKSLSAREKGDALVKRAEIMIGVNKRRRVDSALEDLVEAVELTRDNCKAFCLLGQCYEFKGMVDEAVGAYNQALVLDPASALARDGLDRFKSS
ncbi:uncharacterized protein LOC141643322 [Silene latifolia]|uniref:uncharacterized protein LOC141643322 n=1 Tax=Silene latifolia TaxID=37657 RepID=UPI003D77C4C3